MPEKAGFQNGPEDLDSRLRGNDSQSLSMKESADLR
jgi:hypothetical protein